MEHIIGHRQCGKTEAALKIATTENIPILVKDINTKRKLALRQSGLGEYNPSPLAINDLLQPNFRGASSVIVDDADIVLQELLHNRFNIKSLRAVTMTDVDLPPDQVPNMNITVNDFISKIDKDSEVIIVHSFQDNKLWDNFGENHHKSIEYIPDSLKSSWITHISVDDMGCFVINIGKPY